MRSKLREFSICVGIVALPLLSAGNITHAGALYGLDHPDRRPGHFIVRLKRDRILSLKRPELTDFHEEATHSLKLQAARMAVVAEVEQMASKLATAHPRIKVSTGIASDVVPGFLMETSDDEAKALAAEAAVERVDADVNIRNVTTTSTSQSPVNWGLDRIDQGDSASTAILDNSYAWSATGAGVNVYILDSGIMTNHAEFGGRATNDADFVGDSSGLGWCASNINGAAAGHGTEVASIVGGATYGVAKQVLLHSVRVADCDDNTTYGIVTSGLSWLYNHAYVRNSVLNISLGWLNDKFTGCVCNFDAPTQQFVADTQNYLASMSRAGITIVMSAGNLGQNHPPEDSWPQALVSYSSAIGQNAYALVVGATAYRSDNVWSGTSMSGPSLDLGGPDIFAPGDRVTTAWISSKTASQSADSGTSLAAPYVSGVAALAASLGDYDTVAPLGTAVYQSIVTSAYGVGILDGVVPGVCNLHRPAQARDYCYATPDVLSSLVPGNNPVPTIGGGSGGGGSGGGTPSQRFEPILDFMLLFGTTAMH